MKLPKQKQSELEEQLKHILLICDCPQDSDCVGWKIIDKDEPEKEMIKYIVKLFRDLVKSL